MTVEVTLAVALNTEPPVHVPVRLAVLVMTPRAEGFKSTGTTTVMTPPPASEPSVHVKRLAPGAAQLPWLGH